MNAPNNEIPLCETFSTPHSHPSWASDPAFFLRVRCHVSQSCSTTGNIIVLYILILNSLREVEKTNVFVRFSMLLQISCFLYRLDSEFQSEVQLSTTQSVLQSELQVHNSRGNSIRLSGPN